MRDKQKIIINVFLYTYRELLRTFICTIMRHTQLMIMDLDFVLNLDIYIYITIPIHILHDIIIVHDETSLILPGFEDSR